MSRGEWNAPNAIDGRVGAVINVSTLPATGGGTDSGLLTRSALALTGAGAGIVLIARGRRQTD